MSETHDTSRLANRSMRALSRWIKAGRPVRSEEEVKRILLTYCEPCRAYGEGRCRYCGCQVNLIGTAPQNKIAMATEECPLTKWGGNNE
jgi:hypothetical protein